jgi:hypothetical protein
MADDDKDSKDWSLIYWIIALIVIFFFGPTIMNMFNNSNNRFGVDEIGVQQTVTDLLSNT